MLNSPEITEADILEEVVAPSRPGFTPEGARSILALQFGKQARKNIQTLLRKNNRGTITAAERMTLEKYLRVGQFLDLIRAKARLSLDRSAAHR